jgi:hypothetical protein
METLESREDKISYGRLLSELDLNDLQLGDAVVVHTMSGSTYVFNNSKNGLLGGKPGEKQSLVINSQLKVGKSLKTQSIQTSSISAIRVGRQNECMKFNASPDELVQLEAEMKIKERAKGVIEAGFKNGVNAMDTFMRFVNRHDLGHLLTYDQLDLTQQEKDAIGKVITEIMAGSSKVENKILISALKENNVQAVVSWTNTNLQ